MSSVVTEVAVDDWQAFVDANAAEENKAAPTASRAILLAPRVRTLVLNFSFRLAIYIISQGTPSKGTKVVVLRQV